MSQEQTGLKNYFAGFMQPVDEFYNDSSHNLQLTQQQSFASNDRNIQNLQRKTSGPTKRDLSPESLIAKF